MSKWRNIRKGESGGFMAKRLLAHFLRMDTVLLGSSFCVDYGKFKRYINPQDVVLHI